MARPDPTQCIIIGIYMMSTPKLHDLMVEVHALKAENAQLKKIAQQQAEEAELSQLEAELRAEDAEEAELAQLEAELRAEDAEEAELAQLEAELRAEDAEEAELAQLEAELRAEDAEEAELAQLEAELRAEEAELAQLQAKAEVEAKPASSSLLHRLWHQAA
jgi:hypothetical protein